MNEYNPALYNDDDGEYYEVLREKSRNFEKEKKKISFGPVVTYNSDFQANGIFFGNLIFIKASLYAKISFRVKNQTRAIVLQQVFCL